MKARYALLSIVLFLPACGGFRERDPLSGMGREHGPLVLDRPERDFPPCEEEEGE